MEAAPRSMPPRLIKRDGSMFMASDDDNMLKQILATHSHDGREIDVRLILHIVEDILNRATATDILETIVPAQCTFQKQIQCCCSSSVKPHLHTLSHSRNKGVHHGPSTRETIEDKAQQVGVTGMPEALSHIIDRISSELAGKCLEGGDGHQTTVSIFNMVSSYSWEAKLVLTLAAFGLNYGEFWLLAQIYSSNQLAKSMAILKRLPVIMDHSGQLKPRFDALDILIKAMLDLTKCIVSFKELPSKYINYEMPALAAAAAAATIPTAVYWTVRAVVACATQITRLTSMGHELYIGSTTEARELSTLAQWINEIHDDLRKQLDARKKFVDEKRDIEAYESLVRIFETVHIDNVIILKALIYVRDDLQLLLDGSSKRRVNVEVLRRKNVLLLISGLDISQDELSILEQIYNQSRRLATRNRMETLYEMVWLPIVDSSVPWTDPMQKQFETIQSAMPWYSVHHPSLIDRAVIRLVREKFHFRNKPIIVVLDPRGRVVNPNAIHMMWIWANNAFPFSSLREEALWKEETWRLEFLVKGIDPTVLNWIREGKYIILYGGDDMEWIRRFTTTARSVAQQARVPLEMVYVGKSSNKEQVRRAIATITAEELSHTWQYVMIWFFWTRLKSMLSSKIQLGRGADDNDPMMREIMTLRSYDKNGGWVVFRSGSEANAHMASISSATLSTVEEILSFTQSVLRNRKWSVAVTTPSNAANPTLSPLTSASTSAPIDLTTDDVLLEWGVPSSTPHTEEWKMPEDDSLFVSLHSWLKLIEQGLTERDHRIIGKIPDLSLMNSAMLKLCKATFDAYLVFKRSASYLDQVLDLSLENKKLRCIVESLSIREKEIRELKTKQEALIAERETLRAIIQDLSFDRDDLKNKSHEEASKHVGVEVHARIPELRSANQENGLVVREAVKKSSKDLDVAWSEVAEAIEKSRSIQGASSIYFPFHNCSIPELPGYLLDAGNASASSTNCVASGEEPASDSFFRGWF